MSDLEKRLAVFTGKQLATTLGEGFRSIGKGFIAIDRKVSKEAITQNAHALVGHIRYTQSMDLAMRVAYGCMLAEWLARNPHLDGDPVAAAVEMGIVDQADRGAFDEIWQCFKLATWYSPDDIMPGVAYGYYRRLNGLPPLIEEVRANAWVERRRELLKWVAESPVRIRMGDFYKEAWASYQRIKAPHGQTPKTYRALADIRDELLFLITIRDGLSEGRWTEAELEAVSPPHKLWSLKVTELHTRLEAAKAEMENRKKIPATLDDMVPPWMEIEIEAKVPEAEEAEVVDENLVEPEL